MKIVNAIQTQTRKQRAFTMIEIAIALAVIAFALVAIIGILPTGLTAQKGNREETIINQEGPYFLEVIRSGGIGFEHLTNNIDTITVITVESNGTLTSHNDYYPEAYKPLNLYSSNMVGLLSLPRGTPFPGATDRPVERVVAQVRALSGAAVETGGASKDFAFSYQLTVEVNPLAWQTNSHPVASVVAPDLSDLVLQTNYVKQMQAHVYEVRVTCRWPMLPGDKPGPNRKTFRTLVSGRVINPHGPHRFFQTQQFTKQP